MNTYYAEADALHRAYTEAVGWCLQYRIKVYRPGGGPRGLWEMRTDIVKYRTAHGLDAHTGEPLPTITPRWGWKSFAEQVEDVLRMQRIAQHYSIPVVTTPRQHGRLIFGSEA